MSDTRYDQLLQARTAKYLGTATPFDPSDLDPRFIEYFNSGDRIKVAWGPLNQPPSDRPVNGCIGVSMGFRPVFLLLHSYCSRSSGHILDDHMTLLAVKPKGTKYYRYLVSRRPGMVNA